MKPKKLEISIVSFLLLFAANAIGQGCSDAGFCTINSFKPNAANSIGESKNQIKIGVSYGKADNGISVIGNYLEYNRQLTTKFGLDIKLTSLAQNGNNISTLGLSDIFVNANYQVAESLKLTLGTKIPLSGANKTKDNLALPMDYQSSLGTFDLIFGIGYQVKNIQVVAALQQPLTQNNNQFIANSYPTASKLRDFQSTNQFKRSGDVLLRVSYPVSVSEKLKITPSLLPIYHLTNDKYSNESNTESEVIGSKGLTLNGNIYLDYIINNKNAIQLNVGMPFVVREKRPDGLTRSFIANLEYRINF